MLMSGFGNVLRVLLLYVAAIGEMHTVLVSGKLSIHVNTTSYVAVYGTKVTLDCNVTRDNNLEAVHVYWTKVFDRGLIQMNAGYPGTEGMTMEDPSLTITFPKFDDTGQYICAAKSQASNITGEPINLNVIGSIPNVTTDSAMHEVVYGQNITLECYVTSIPVNTNVYWQTIKDGTVTNITSFNHNVNGVTIIQPSLTILKATMSDSGMYACHAENLIGTGQSNFTNLTVVGEIPSVEVGSAFKTAEYGNNVTLDCNVTSFPAHISVYWQRISSGITTNVTSDYCDRACIDGVTVINPSLTILKAKTSDSGLYTCYITNQVGTGQSAAVNLTIIGDIPNVEVGSTTQIVEYGSNVILDCHVTSFPAHTSVYWQRKSNGLTTNFTADKFSSEDVSTLNHSLTISLAKPSDTGLYTCYAVNIVGTGRSKAINLTIIGGIPNVTIDETSYNVEYGQPITIECKITSIPAYTSIYWEKDIGGITTNITSDSTVMDSVAFTTTSISIPKAITADSGIYTCFAVNIAGTGHSGSVNLTVHGDIPSVEVGSTLKVAEYGKNVTLDCNVTSFPAHISVYWQRISSGITTNLTSNYCNRACIDGVTVLNPSLTILKVKTSDSGLYTCYITNKVGTGQSAAVNLTIVGGIPNVRIDETSYTIVYGQAITIKCKITSIPAYTNIYWGKEIRGNTTNIASDSTVMESVTLTTTSLSIPRAIPADSGMYTCYAANIAGTGQSDSVNLTVYGGIPYVYTESDFYEILYGHNHTIICRVNAVPVFTKIYWQKISNGTTTNITSNSPGIDGARITRPSLTILKAAPSDAGQYICIAENVAGIGQSNSINLTVLGEENYPIVGIQLDRYTVKFGESLTIKSFVQTNDEFPVRSVHWQYINNDVLTTIEAGSHGIAGSQIETPSLTIATVTTSESGLYTCFATNDIGTGISKPINVTVVGGLPIVSVRDKKYVSMYSHQVILSAVVKSDPPVRFVYWEKIVEGRRSIINHGAVGTIGVTPDNPSLTVTYSTKADIGAYRCFATNDVGTSRGDIISLQVTGESPTVFVPFYTISVDFGAEMNLSCNVDSSLPITIVYWEKMINGIRSRINYGTVGTTGINANNPSLTILYSTSADSGSYSCFAGNAVGISHSSTINVTVVGGMPAVSIGSLYYKTIYGQEVKLECKITAYPSVTSVYWQKTTGDVITTLNEGSLGTKGINITMPSLIILFPTTADSGSYMCFASNRAGTQKSMAVQLSVEGDIPVVTVRSPQYTAHYGDTVTLECDVNAYPLPQKIFWHKTVNGMIIGISDGFAGTQGSKLSTPSLTIIFASSADTGRYTCIAQNAAGVGHSKSTMLKILADIPEVKVSRESYQTGIGFSITLVCRISKAIPEVSRVYWQRYKNNATTVLTSGSLGIEGVTPDFPSLTIASAKESMSGEYTCFAMNSVGTGSSFPTFLKVAAGITPSPVISASEEEEDDNTDTILEGVLGSIGALTAIVATIIAVREHMKRKKKNIEAGSRLRRKDSRDIIATDQVNLEFHGKRNSTKAGR